MKILVFLMGNAEGFDMAWPLLRTLAGSGVELTVTPYSSEEAVPVDELIETGARLLPLSDGGFGTIPRLSRRQYEALCGDDLDFLGCQYHNLARLGYPLARDYLFRDSMFHQWFHGFAYRAEVLLRESRPDAVILHGGSEPISKILFAKSNRLGLPTLLLETAFVPGKVVLDPVGMHFFPGQHRIEEKWPEASLAELSNEQRERLDDFLSAWRSRGISKYPQPESPSEVEAFERFRESGRRLLFVVDQVPHDANILNGTRAFDSIAAMVDLARTRLPEDWAAVYKLHPRNPASAEATLGLDHERFLTVRDLSIHRLFQASDAILTYSSNVGLEAIAVAKPVLVAGQPHYGNRGLTLDLESPDDLPRLLDESLHFRPDPEIRDRYLHHVFFDYLVDASDPKAVLDRIEEARTLGTREPSRCPFERHDAPRFEEFRSLALSYNQLAEENLAHEEIMERLGLATGSESESEPWSKLDSGERQVAVDYSGISANHLIRYQFARALLRPGMDILDLSCGTGYGTHLLSEGARVRRVVGVDCSAEAIAFAREFWASESIEYVEASAGGLTWEESAFDLIVSFETVEHLANDRAFVSKLWRALRPGGVLLLSAPHQNGYPMSQHAFHVQHYSAEGLRSLIQEQPSLDSVTVLGQVADTRLEAREAGKHLIAVARKSDPEVAGSDFPDRLARLLPFEGISQPARPRPRIRFNPHRFLGDAGDRQDGAIVATEEAANRHIAYGPFAKLAAGDYLAGFLLSLDGQPTGNPGARIVLDVANGQGQPMARFDLSEHQLRDLAGQRRLVPLPFRHETAEDDLQFRIFLEGQPFRGRLAFHGLDLRGSTMSNDANQNGDPLTPEAAFPMMDLVELERQRTEAAHREVRQVQEEFAQARSAFAEANAFYERSREDWEDRFREYERRLLKMEQKQSELVHEKGLLTWDRDEFRRLYQEHAQQVENLSRELDRVHSVAGDLIAERDGLAHQLVDLQTRHRPYHLIDRLGMVQKSYGLARRIKRRLAS